MGTFVSIEGDEFNPEYGDINWRERFEQVKSERDVQMIPVGYHEEGKPVMQVTQENTMIYINQVSDELDCVAVQYDQDEDDIFTFYFREKFENDETFAHVVGVVGMWATQIVTLYPCEHIVDRYEGFHQTPDTIPEDW